MNQYSDSNPPKRGTGRKIYQALKYAGFDVYDLHYNPNCWGRAWEAGWGTWTCDIGAGKRRVECWCGWDGAGVYLQDKHVPYALTHLRRAPKKGASK